jgi:hypothetical protein
MTSDARMHASRQNGTRSRGPRTVAGKARSARNALKHGLRARKLVLLEGEDAAEFRRFARALEAELAPAGQLQADLVGRIAIAAWRARRADQLEAGVLGGYLEAAGAADPDRRAFLASSADLGGRRRAERLATGLTRDNYGPRALATLVRYRGSVLAELFRSLAALKLLQAEAPGRRAAGRARLAAAACELEPPQPAEAVAALASAATREPMLPDSA